MVANKKPKRMKQLSSGQTFITKYFVTAVWVSGAIWTAIIPYKIRTKGRILFGAALPATESPCGMVSCEF